MRKSKLIAVLFAAVVVVVACTVSACSGDNTEYTVTFDCVGGGTISPQTVKSGEQAIEPTAPRKTGYDFVGWFIGGTPYKFDTPVTKDIVLTAEWKAETYTVTFDSGEGSSVEAKTANYGSKIARPQDPTREGYRFVGWAIGETMYDFDTLVSGNVTLTAVWEIAKYTVTFDADNGSQAVTKTVTHGKTVEKPETPTREGFYFEGWYINETKYDFSAPITATIVLKAKWSAVETIDAAFTAALAADYSDFTSDSTVTDESGSYTDTFKQTENLAYWKSGSALYDDHIVVFDDNGNMLAMYYLHDDEWKKSGLISYADFVVALYLDEIELSDVEYSEGVYHVVPASLEAVVYALFRSNESYTDLYIRVEDGRICQVVGALDGMTHEQTFYDFGETTVTLPAIPAVTVVIETKDKEAEAGTAIDAAELIGFAFTVKVEGKNYAVTADMVSFGGLALDNPVDGTYTLTLTFETWDGVTHTETATVTVKTPQAEETFAQIFAKDYSNVTITSGDTTYRRAGEVYTSSKVANAYYFAEADKTLTKYTVSGTNCTETANNWFVLPRLELLFALDGTIFQPTDESNVYVAKNVEAIKSVLQKTTLMKTYTIDESNDYSITLTVSLGRVTGISFDYYSKATASAKATARSLTYTLSDFGTTEIVIPDVVTDKRG